MSHPTDSSSYVLVVSIALLVSWAAGGCAGCHFHDRQSADRGSDTGDQSWTASSPTDEDAVTMSDVGAGNGTDGYARSTDDGTNGQESSEEGSRDAGTFTRDAADSTGDTGVNVDTDDGRDAGSDAKTQSRPELAYCLSKYVPARQRRWSHTPLDPSVGIVVTFISNASSDPYDSKWDLDADGEIEDSSRLARWAFRSAGRHKVTHYLLEDGCVVDISSKIVLVRR